MSEISLISRTAGSSQSRLKYLKMLAFAPIFPGQVRISSSLIQSVRPLGTLGKTLS
ncbi:hypothetical protein D9M68_402570 [compost metagenome]